MVVDNRGYITFQVYVKKLLGTVGSEVKENPGFWQQGQLDWFTNGLHGCVLGDDVATWINGLPMLSDNDNGQVHKAYQGTQLATGTVTWMNSAVTKGSEPRGLSST